MANGMTKSRTARNLMAAWLTLAALAGPCLAPGQLHSQTPAPLARDENAPPLPANDSDKTTRLTVLVLDEATRKPVYNAHVVVRFERDRKLRRDQRVSWESKASQKGEVILGTIPRGTVKVQVIARGYQTYGDQHELTQSEQTVTISMKTPSGQKSAY